MSRITLVTLQLLVAVAAVLLWHVLTTVPIGGVKLLITFAERYSTRASEIRLDVVVLGFTLALSVTLALLLSSEPRGDNLGLGVWCVVDVEGEVEVGVVQAAKTA